MKKRSAKSGKERARSLQERMFRLFIMIGRIGLVVRIVTGFVLKESYWNIIPLAVFIVLLTIASEYALRTHKIQTGAVIIAVITIFGMLPHNFLTSGGIYGGGPIWFLFCMVYICMAVEGKSKYFFLGSGFVIGAVCYYIAYYYPSLIIQHTVETAYLDSLITLLLVTGLFCGMLLYQIYIYRFENVAMQEQKKEIEELNRAQNHFFTSMSHEIRTPINTIIGLNEMILREAVTEEIASDALNIQSASKMLLTTINDILDLSKIESGRMEIIPGPYDFGSMLSELVNIVWVRAKEKGLSFHIDVDQTVPARMIGDEVRIKQILLNVLNNAVKYTMEGTVNLSVQCNRLDSDRVEITYTVTDTGIGIKKENIPNLFSAFKRVEEDKNRYIEGTGLGLSIVKQLVDLMGGEIAVNSVYTKGSTFAITLPQQSAGPEELGLINFEKRRVLSGREHYRQSFEAPKASVLLVDDNETNLMVAQKLLRDTRVKIDLAMSGEECLKKTSLNHYDTIFMDHLMPVMDGIECLHAIRKQAGGLNLNTPVVIVTANAGSENQALYHREGFDGYLVKPIVGTQLEMELLRHLPDELVSITKDDGTVGVVETPIVEYNRKIPLMISTDSVCDLPREMLERYQIAVMPYRVITESGEFLDGIETETKGILSYIGEHGKRIASAAPDMNAYEEFFAEQLTRAQSIIHISMAKNVSLGYENAMEASQTFDNVTVVDSGHLSSGMGLVVLCAAEMAEEGATVDEIVEEIRHMVNRVKTSFIVDNTEYLARSGRLSRRLNTVCKALMLHPVIALKNYRMKVGTAKLGTREYSRRQYVKSALRPAHEIDKRILFITYAGLKKDELQEIENEVRKHAEFEKIVYQNATPAISTNCGPGSFGLIYRLNS